MQNCYKTNLPRSSMRWQNYKNKAQPAEYTLFSVMDIDLQYSVRAETTACFSTVKLHDSTRQGLPQPPRGSGTGWGHPRAPPKCVTEARRRVGQGQEQTWLCSAHGWAGLWHWWHWGQRWGPVPWVGWHGCPLCPDSMSVNLSIEQKYRNVHLQQPIFKANRHPTKETIHFDRVTAWHWESCYTYFHVWFPDFLSKFIKGEVSLGRSHSPIRTCA